MLVTMILEFLEVYCHLARGNRASLLAVHFQLLFCAVSQTAAMWSCKS